MISTISARYLPGICVLLALALVPTFVHSYTFAPPQNQRVTAAIPMELAGYRGAKSSRNEGWGQRRFATDDWIERDYVQGSTATRLTVVRSYDAKSLYHHPELAVAYGTAFQGEKTVRATLHPDVPVHVMTPGPGVSARAMYVLLYEGRYVDDPLQFQLRTAGELLFSSRKPMTLFFAFEPTANRESVLENQSSFRVLVAALAGYAPTGSGRTAG